MRYSKQIKPISYLKANADAMIKMIAETRQPVVITQHGEARAVLQDVGSYERAHEALVLLKILARATRDRCGAHRVGAHRDRTPKESTGAVTAAASDRAPRG